ncbi:uncharacterized protein LOC108037355 isoform X4 [Drosophila rhopaloa]|uniref:Uncharacterized protein LOC108037355 isoform X3 n=1 Tax=Drosophila rhopaloa TaxID=1041015 RepID=A0A6P4DUZ5_DRORH|nr:uncharacterized protein LOC108037355 isoform X4 [Drosophila rhopaloa]
MRHQCHSALRNLVRQCNSTTIKQSWPYGQLLGTHLLNLPSSSTAATCTTSSSHYSKFSTHLSTERAMELLCNLDEEERSNLRCALGKIDADKEKKLYESQLAVGSWRTRFGRLSNKAALGQVIAGTFCAVPDDWLRKKMVESAAPPTAGQLYSSNFFCECRAVYRVRIS